jgi:AraC family transcriptional regulator
VAGKTLQHKAVEGGLAVFPAGIDTAADCDRDVRSLLIAIDPGRLTLASSEDGASRAQLIERLNGHDAERFPAEVLKNAALKDRYVAKTL